VDGCEQKRAEEIAELAVDLVIIALQLAAPHLDTRTMARLAARRGTSQKRTLSEADGYHSAGCLSALQCANGRPEADTSRADQGSRGYDRQLDDPNLAGRCNYLAVLRRLLHRRSHSLERFDIGYGQAAALRLKAHRNRCTSPGMLCLRPRLNAVGQVLRKGVKPFGPQ
jgi:hypothetical protein